VRKGDLLFLTAEQELFPDYDLSGNWTTV